MPFLRQGYYPPVERQRQAHRVDAWTRQWPGPLAPPLTEGLTLQRAALHCRGWPQGAALAGITAPTSQGTGSTSGGQPGTLSRRLERGWPGAPALPVAWDTTVTLQDSLVLPEVEIPSWLTYFHLFYKNKIGTIETTHTPNYSVFHELRAYWAPHLPLKWGPHGGAG